ncbi:helix-turn-helix domain-containing protein [Methylobacterium bullatum]|uniref:HTH-type transcriptional regulator NimR n=1 Tax=Methylobacterium bullatum TaxID=570505 RepID=A0AAV4ZE44_9HYPH|nr:helix-turn-helix transcriptional regulator [Methylobacterium bullatum]MBD8903614.1 AraC family transcriptional regulator [Methylobacterium bullatum]GJD41919.1 HTH-type transcriptional regulator NimR [Methylobacterium bullatum]
MAMVESDAVFAAHDVPRGVSAVGMDLVTDGLENHRHAHRKGQLILTARGMVTCDVAKGLWMVPPQCALWIPGDIEHSVRVVGDVELYVLFIDPDIAGALPSECCTITISSLLRELVIAVSHLTEPYDDDGPHGRLIQTMLDQLSVAPVERLHLPLPTDPRLRRIADGLTSDPSDRATVGEWARRVAMSERTLFRLILRETGMSFGRWRQQFQIMLALERLATGEAVQTVAMDLGYESASAFITMFKKALGQPPSRYLRSRRGHSSALAEMSTN